VEAYSWQGLIEFGTRWTAGPLREDPVWAGQKQRPAFAVARTFEWNEKPACRSDERAGRNPALGRIDGALAHAILIGVRPWVQSRRHGVRLQLFCG